MPKKTEIAFVRSVKEDVESSDFFARACDNRELRDFLITRKNARNIEDILRQWIMEHGISSLFHSHITCDAVMHPGITVDKIETLILEFVRKLQGVKNLLIIDPYFYSSEPAVLDLFESMVCELSTSLENVTFFTNEKARDSTEMHAILRRVVPSIEIKDVKTDDFHDRFWIDSERGQGLVMGTSLNGVTKKIALIDHLRPADAAHLARMAMALI